MSELTFAHYFGIAITLLLITAVGIYSGRMVKTSGDFATGGRRAGSGIVAGTIMGTLVGGSSTIGTAQLAFSNGFSAWWFTLGAGIGCLLLGLFFAKPVNNSNIDTVPHALTNEYGKTAGPISSVFVSVGIFLNVIAQILAGIALITSVTKISSIQAAIITAVLMAAYVIFGGVWGTGLVGIAKLILLYTAVVIGGVAAVVLAGGVSTFTTTLPSAVYFNLFSRGVSIDVGAGLSLVLGVLSTQTYIQAIIAAKGLKHARKGALVSAVLIPPIGIAGIFIGMYMKIYFPNIKAASALPLFIMQNMPPFVAGVIIATLFVALIGTGAGLSLGISSIMTHDIFKTYIKKDASDSTMLKTNRVIIALVLITAVIFTTGNLGSLILGWGFMSMGLRAAAVFAPFCGALFLKGRIRPKFAVAAIIAGPLAVLFGKLVLNVSYDPLFLGVGISILIMIFGIKKKEITKSV